MKNACIVMLFLLVAGSFLFPGCLKESRYLAQAARSAGAAGNATVTAPATQAATPQDLFYGKKAEAIAQAIDYRDPAVHNFALQQISAYHSGDYTTAQICDIWDVIRVHWTYVSDAAGMNYYTPASDSIKNGLKGNCLDYAILNAAVIESIGGSARVITVDSPTEEGHAYAEVYVANTTTGLQALKNYIGTRYYRKTISYDREITPDGQIRYWLNLDWQSDYPGGAFYQGNGTRYAFYPNGEYQMIGTNT